MIERIEKTMTREKMEAGTKRWRTTRNDRDDQTVCLATMMCFFDGSDGSAGEL